MRITHTSRGFTVVEVLVVVIVVSILATITVAVNTKIQKQVRDSERETDISIVTKALEAFHRKNGGYPAHTQFADTQSGETIRVLLNIPSVEPLIAPTLGSTATTNSYMSTANCAESGLQAGFNTKLNYSYCTSGVCNAGFCTAYQIMYYREIDDTMVTVSGQYNS